MVKIKKNTLKEDDFPNGKPKALAIMLLEGSGARVHYTTLAI